MSYCLNCHRDPTLRLRPLEEITQLDWKAPTQEAQLELGTGIVHNWRVESLQNCSTCHR
jgi:mono/diheme cytochrome c family protein